jgi:hypothetical protein
MAFEVDGKLHITVAAGGNFQFNYKARRRNPGVALD